jgi:hypothetical protein
LFPAPKHDWQRQSGQRQSWQQPIANLNDKIQAAKESNMPGKVWTREKLIQTIKELHEQGYDLSPTAIQKTHGALFSSARSASHFGKWRDAVEAAGLRYDDIKRTKQRWSREEIVKQIKAQHKNGEDLLHPDFKLRHRNLYLAACAHRYFGSWRRAVIAAGLDHEKMRESRVWTRGRILRTIREMAKAGRPLGWAVIEVSCPGVYRAARRRENFGSWQGALTAANVPPALRGRRPREINAAPPQQPRKRGRPPGKLKKSQTS